MGWFAACVLLCSIVCFSWAIHLSADPSGPSLVPPLFFLLVGSLTFLSPSLSIVSKTFSLPSLSLYLCFRVLTVSCRLTDFSRPCCIDGVKKASGENKTQALQCICCHQCPDLIFFKLTLTDATFPSSQELQSMLLGFPVLWAGMARFISQQELRNFTTGLSTRLHLWTWWEWAMTTASQRTTRHHTLTKAWKTEDR